MTENEKIPVTFFTRDNIIESKDLLLGEVVAQGKLCFIMLCFSF